jgi:uncharacterized protein (TIGR02118 family)
MIKVSVLYPNTSGARFDMNYYLTRHMPMVQEKCGPACRAIAVEGGLAGGEPGSQPPFLAAGHLTFESVSAFEKSFGPHAPEILADIPNYTNTKPVIQIAEIKT